ncbi:hypothetical protein KUDE01_030950 [Dissostichus eleginoides]|uniref:Uncharacterized protein n=1 Tax=Dissostichus eleginoides TaxID=100907 RepID=A0AAD9F108_DISEL|nr:hypothetical protein KUDE01_030950 [Dissostichus eleginoides]
MEEEEGEELRASPCTAAVQQRKEGMKEGVGDGGGGVPHRRDPETPAEPRQRAQGQRLQLLLFLSSLCY